MYIEMMETALQLEEKLQTDENVLGMNESDKLNALSR